MTGLQGRTAVVAGLQPSPHRHMLLGVEQLFAESGGILHEVVCGADTECTVVIFDVHLSEIDHHVFVQVSLASQIAAKEVKGKGEQILGVLMGTALAVAAGTITRCVAIIGKKENDLICCCLLSGLCQTDSCGEVMPPIKGMLDQVSPCMQKCSGICRHGALTVARAQDC